MSVNPLSGYLHASYPPANPASKAQTRLEATLESLTQKERQSLLQGLVDPRTEEARAHLDAVLGSVTKEVRPRLVKILKTPNKVIQALCDRDTLGHLQEKVNQRAVITLEELCTLLRLSNNNPALQKELTQKIVKLDCSASNPEEWMTDEELLETALTPNLQELNLSGNNRITCKGLRFISSIASETLRSLNLTDCENIQGDVLKELTGLKHLTNLNLSGCKPDLEKFLNELGNLASLNTFTVAGCFDMSTLNAVGVFGQTLNGWYRHEPTSEQFFKASANPAETQALIRIQCRILSLQSNACWLQERMVPIKGKMIDPAIDARFDKTLLDLHNAEELAKTLRTLLDSATAQAQEFSETQDLAKAHELVATLQNLGEVQESIAQATQAQEPAQAHAQAQQPAVEPEQSGPLFKPVVPQKQVDAKDEEKALKAPAAAPPKAKKKPHGKPQQQPEPVAAPAEKKGKKHAKPVPVIPKRPEFPTKNVAPKEMKQFLLDHGFEETGRVEGSHWTLKHKKTGVGTSVVMNSHDALSHTVLKSNRKAFEASQGL